MTNENPIGPKELIKIVRGLDRLITAEGHRIEEIIDETSGQIYVSLQNINDYSEKKMYAIIKNLIFTVNTFIGGILFQEIDLPQPIWKNLLLTGSGLLAALTGAGTFLRTSVIEKAVNDLRLTINSARELIPRHIYIQLIGKVEELINKEGNVKVRKKLLALLERITESDGTGQSGLRFD